MRADSAGTLPGWPDLARSEPWRYSAPRSGRRRGGPDMRVPFPEFQAIRHVDDGQLPVPVEAVRRYFLLERETGRADLDVDQGIGKGDKLLRRRLVGLGLAPFGIMTCTVACSPATRSTKQAWGARLRRSGLPRRRTPRRRFPVESGG